MADFAKKLTVSFGAFSCTLSGFDDPFPTMRQVVDYFQNLSKSDPAFGAHPERPDTEALKALAEKVSGLSVDAEMNGDEVILSSVEDDMNEPEVKDEYADTVTSTSVTEVAEAEVETIASDMSPVMENLPARDPVDRDLMAFDEAIEPMRTAKNDELVEEYKDIFEQLQLEDLDDELFENIDADAIYDEVESDETPQEPVEQANVNTYLEENVAFEDVDEPDEEPLITDSFQQEAITAVAEAALPEETDQIPVWAAELVSDEPIEPIEAPSSAQIDDFKEEDAVDDDEPTFDEHLEAEQRALQKILSATRQSTEQITDEPRELETSSDEPLVETAKAAPIAPKVEPKPEKPLVLSFGDQSDFEMPEVVVSGRVEPKEDINRADVLETMGLHDEDHEEFGWDDPKPASDETEAAPLLLTPVQQVEVEEFEPEEAITPMSTIDLAQEDPRADLRRFAASAGAVSMTDLLEASAAYATLINGRPSFSRGEVLDLLDEFSEEDGFSQETRIKTFGSLLRGGRIQPVENGEYEMSDDALSDYEARRTG